MLRRVRAESVHELKSHDSATGANVESAFRAGLIAQILRDHERRQDRILTEVIALGLAIGIRKHGSVILSPALACLPFSGKSGSMKTYPGFWIRVGAYFLDAIILSPWSIFAGFLVYFSIGAQIFLIVPQILVVFGYFIYLVYRYHGTPAMRVLDLRVVKVDGGRIDLASAFWRHAIRFFLVVGVTIGSAIGASSVDTAVYANAGFLERSQMMSKMQPLWVSILSGLASLYVIVDLLWIFTNPEHRQINDYIAGTKLIRDEPAPDQSIS